MLCVLRSSGAWSLGWAQRRAGRAANRARRFGGSLCVMFAGIGGCWDEEGKIVDLMTMLRDEVSL